MNKYMGVNWSTTTRNIDTASRHNFAAGMIWPPSSYFEISINLKACIILE